MTFKEQLTAKAEQTDIQKEINYIKQKLEEFYYKRTFTVCLYKAHQTLAIGGNANKNSVECFIPESFSLSPESYRRLFVEAFKELGFTDKDITLEESHCERYDVYYIILKW